MNSDTPLGEDKYDIFTDTERVVLQVTQVIVFLIGILVLILCLFNVKNYLISQKRYRDISTSLFYLSAFTVTVLILVQTYFVPIRDYCLLGMIFITYGIPLLNLNLGICQACMLTTLFIRLNQLFHFKKDLAKPVPQERTQKLYQQ